jgi:hypothetical protein
MIDVRAVGSALSRFLEKHVHRHILQGEPAELDQDRLLPSQAVESRVRARLRAVS